STPSKTMRSNGGDDELLNGPLLECHGRGLWASRVTHRHLHHLLPRLRCRVAGPLLHARTDLRHRVRRQVRARLAAQDESSATQVVELLEPHRRKVEWGPATGWTQPHVLRRWPRCGPETAHR